MIEQTPCKDNLVVNDDPNFLPVKRYLTNISEDLLDDHKAKFVWEEIDGVISFPYTQVSLNHGEKVNILQKKVDIITQEVTVGTNEKPITEPKMNKPRNPENVYELTCKVTGKTKRTNPNQFKKLCDRNELNSYEMQQSYVSPEGRRQIEKEYLTPQEAVDQYNIHINVAERLRATVKSKNTPTPVALDEDETTEGVDVEDKCANCLNPDKVGYHSCPFQEEMNGNYDQNYCNCDREGIRRCKMDI